MILITEFLYMNTGNLILFPSFNLLNVVFEQLHFLNGENIKQDPYFSPCRKLQTDEEPQHMTGYSKLPRGKSRDYAAIHIHN